MDRKYGRIFTMADVEKIFEWFGKNWTDAGGAEMNIDVDTIIESMDAEGVRFKFPEDEPVMVFRARDKRAIGVIRHYEDHQSPRAPVAFLESIQDARRDFEQYREDHPEMIKEPD